MYPIYLLFDMGAKFELSVSKLKTDWRKLLDMEMHNLPLSLGLFG
jgi:hypothetical protein